MNLEEMIEKECQIADAKLAVAEHLGYVLAFAIGLCIFLKWDSWLLAIAGGIAAYVLATRPYSKEHDRAWAAAKFKSFADTE